MREVTQAGAAVAFGDGHAEQSELAELLPHVGGKLVRAVDLGGARCELGVAHALHRVAQSVEFLGEVGIEQQRGSLDDCACPLFPGQRRPNPLSTERRGAKNNYTLSRSLSTAASTAAGWSRCRACPQSARKSVSILAAFTALFAMQSSCAGEAYWSPSPRIATIGQRMPRISSAMLQFRNVASSQMSFQP